MGEGGESKKFTFLDPKGGEPVSLSFESGGAATVSGFSSHGPVSPKLTDGFLPGDSLNKSHDVRLPVLIYRYLSGCCLLLWEQICQEGVQQGKCLHWLASANEGARRQMRQPISFEKSNYDISRLQYKICSEESHTQ